MRVDGLAGRILTTLLLATVVAVAGFGGYLIYSTARQAVVQAQFELPDAPSLGASQPEPAPTDQAPSGSAPLATPTVATASAAGVERLNIMVLGLDVVDGSAEPARTDSIIIISIDPSGGPIAMLSIPRDLYVPIAQYGENRINTAYFLGEVKKYPGGGPGLLRATIEQTFGIPIRYYISVDFAGFRELIDQLGGVHVVVENDIYDPAFPDGEGGTITVSIPAGDYLMDGESALRYARSRHTSTDFDRAARQQRLLMAIRDELLGRESVTSLVTKAPILYRNFSRYVETDMSLENLVSLGRLAMSLDLSNVRAAVIDQTMTTRYITDAGSDVLLPISEKIHPLIQQLFLPPRDAPAAVEEGDDAPSQLRAEAARVMIENGSGKPGLAAEVTEYLRAQGISVSQSSDLELGDYATTVVVSYSQKPVTVAAIVAALHLGSANVRLPSAGVNPEQIDVKVILGKDFVLPTG